MTSAAKNWFSLFVSACAVLSVVEGARKQLASVTVRRCCGPGEVLDTSAAAWSCSRDATNDTRWTPRVYAPGPRTFLPLGTVPQHWNVVVGSPDCGTTATRPELDDETVPYIVFAHNASLFLRRAGVFLGPHEWCGDRKAALVCREETRPRAPKCCPVSEAFSTAEGRCNVSEAAVVSLNALKSLLPEDEELFPQLGGGWPACEEDGYAVVGELSGATLQSDGSLLLGASQLESGSWCAEFVMELNTTAVLSCGGGEGSGRTRHVLYGVGLAIGACFLLATLLASRLLPAQHHALHGRCQSRYVFTLMLGDVLLSVTQLAGDEVPPVPCKVLAVCMHFLFLSAFFWLNTMCFNIWWTFRDFRPTSLERGQETRRLRLYRAYAWGAPLLLAGAAAIMDSVPGAFSPRFAERRCWFYGDAELLAFFFGPVGALLLVNLLLFLSTARQLTCGLWRRDDLKASSERAALGRVCAKLLVVMGVSWGADVISWAAGGPHALWYLTDLLNALQGVLVFCVVGCRAPVAAAARRTLGRMCPRLLPPLTAPPPAPTSCGDSLTHTTAALQAAPAPHETMC